MNRLLEAGQAFIWTDECEVAFEDLKAALTGEEIMAFQRDEGPFILDTDASDYGIGGVLSQMQYDERLDKELERPISFASKSLTKTQRRYCVTRRELLAVVTFIQHFKQYLLGRKFVIRTDHSALRWVLSLFLNPENQLARWIEILSQYDFTVIYRRGIKHSNANFLSRVGESSSCDCYDGQTILADLLCSGCTDCLKKHEQWSSFLQADNVVPMKLNRADIWIENSNRSFMGWNYLGLKYILECLDWLFCVVLLSVIRFPGHWIKSLQRLRINRHRNEQLQVQNVTLNSRKTGEVKHQFNFKMPSYSTGYTSVDLAKLQKNNPEVGTVIKWLEENHDRPPRETVTSQSPLIRHLWLLWSQLVLIDGVLYKIWYPKSSEQSSLQLVAPRSTWKELLEATHNSKFAGH